MIPHDDQFDEYRLPGDEPMKHQWDTNVQFDWYRHLDPKTQKKLSPEGDHAKAWDKHQKNLDIEHMAESYNEPKIQKLPGMSLYNYYNKGKKRR